MLSTIREYVITIITFILMIVIFLIFVFNSMSFPPLDAENYYAKEDLFISCDPNYSERSLKAEKINSNEFIYLSDEELQAQYVNFDFQSKCDSSYVKSSSEQIQEYAFYAISIADEYLEDPKLIDAVYTASSDYYAYLSIPQEYLFFAMDSNMTTIIPILISPNLDGTYNYSVIWDEEIGSDSYLSGYYTKHLLLKYNEKVKI